MSRTQAPPFQKHFPRSLENLRAALMELYVALGADPEEPQAVARRFGMHRNLAWKLTRVMRSQGSGGVLQYLPGNQGIERAIEAFRAAGAPEARLSAVQHAQAEFDDMVELHAGDRATLELMLDSLGLEGADDALEASRSMAFRGNSGIWGIQARTRLRTDFVAPNAERSDLLDVVLISALIDLRRFRPDAAWPLFQRAQYNDDGSPRDSRIEPLDLQSDDAADTMLWSEFCSEQRPEIRVVPTPLGSRYELVGQTIGNRGLTTCVQGGVMRRFAPRYRDELNTRGDFSAQINAPTQHLLYDLIVHRELADEIEPEALVLQAPAADPAQYATAARIPCTESMRRLESVPPRLSTPLFKRYAELAGRVYEHMGWKAEDFRALRYEMKCPPLHSVVLLHYELPEAP